MSGGNTIPCFLVLLLLFGIMSYANMPGLYRLSRLNSLPRSRIVKSLLRGDGPILGLNLWRACYLLVRVDVCTTGPPQKHSWLKAFKNHFLYMTHILRSNSFVSIRSHLIFIPSYLDINPKTDHHVCFWLLSFNYSRVTPPIISVRYRIIFKAY